MRRLGLPVLVAGLLVGSLLAVRVVTSRRVTGTAQPLLMGTAVTIEPSTVAAPSYKVSPERSYSGVIHLRTEPSGKRIGKGRVRLRLAATLDLSTSIEFGSKAFKAVTVPAASAKKIDLPFTVPPLSPGRHCLVVTLVEDENALGVLDHQMASVVEITAGEGSEQRCIAPSTETAVPASTGVVASCDYPTISPTKEIARLRHRLVGATNVWAHVGGDCPGAEAVNFIFIHDGMPILGRSGSLQPFSIPVDEVVRTVPLGHLPSGSFRLVLVAPGRQSIANVGNPVVVE